MNSAVVVTRDLTKLYHGTAAVDNVSMTIKKGEIYGLIGKNGAGKTTLIRMISSLTSIDSGELELFGKKGNLNNERKRISAIVETPALYPNLSARQNLEYYRILKGVTDRSIIESALELVSLNNTGSKKFKNFSLGMKQRLGLALSIMTSPDLIILDEPINGLDPIGIMEMRETIKKLNTEHGMTVLISSHILSELSLIATNYGIIDNGRMIKEITASELKEECQRCLKINVNDAAAAAVLLETKLGISNYKITNANEVRVYELLEQPSKISSTLVMNNIELNELHEIGDNLEDYFKTLINSH